MSFFAEMADPLEPLRAARVPDEIARPLAELLIVDALVGSGRAIRVTDFRLGAAVRGERRLMLSWEPPRRYQVSAVEPEWSKGGYAFRPSVDSRKAAFGTLQMPSDLP